MLGLAEDVLAGRVDRRKAAVAGQLYNTALRAITTEMAAREQLEFLERLEALEEVLESKKQGGRNSSWGS